MGSWSTRGQNGCAPVWYGALRQQESPPGKWEAYIYYPNREEETFLGLFDTDKKAKQTVDLKARALHGKPTVAAASPPLVSAFEHWQEAGGGGGFSHSTAGYMLMQSGGQGEGREAQGPVYIFWQGSGDDEGPRYPDFPRWQQHGN